MSLATWKSLWIFEWQSTHASWEFNQEVLEEIKTVHVAHCFEDFCYEVEWRDGGTYGGVCVFKVGFHF